jgi:hypothetical protein
MIIGPILSKSVLFAATVTVLVIASSVPGQAKRDPDPLKIYTRCKRPSDLKLKQSIGDRSRPRIFDISPAANGEETVSVVDGYRLMFGYQHLS